MSGAPVSFLLNRPVRNVAQQAMSGVSSGQPAHVSISANRFTLVDTAGNKKPVTVQTQQGLMQASWLDCVIVDANGEVSKIFYEGDYVEGSEDNSPPACFSDNGIGPSSQSPKPQSQQCQICPHNAWGSKISKQGKQVKACNDKKKIALTIGGDPIVYQLQIPPASLKNLRAYMNWVCAQSLGPRNADVTDVVTRIQFESQGVLKFEACGDTNSQEWSQHLETVAADQTKLDAIVGRNDVPYRGAIAAPAPVQQITHQPIAPPIVAQPPQPVPVQVAPAAGPGPALFTAAPPPAVAAQQPAPAAPTGRGRPRGSRNGAGSPVQAPALAAAPVAAPAIFPQQPSATGALPPAQPQPVPATAPVGAPSFLQQAPPPAQHPVAQPQQNFGMVAPAAAPQPDAELKNLLDQAFALPT